MANRFERLVGGRVVPGSRPVGVGELHQHDRPQTGITLHSFAGQARLRSGRAHGLGDAVRQPGLRFDTCDYSLDPRLVGRRVEARVTDREVLAVAMDTGELACLHAWSFAKHRTITPLEHARALKTQRHGRRGTSYDRLIA